MCLYIFFFKFLLFLDFKVFVCLCVIMILLHIPLHSACTEKLMLWHLAEISLPQRSNRVNESRYRSDTLNLELSYLLQSSFLSASLSQ